MGKKRKGNKSSSDTAGTSASESTSSAPPTTLAVLSSSSSSGTPEVARQPVKSKRTALKSLDTAALASVAPPKAEEQPQSIAPQLPPQKLGRGSPQKDVAQAPGRREESPQAGPWVGRAAGRGKTPKVVTPQIPASIGRGMSQSPPPGFGRGISQSPPGHGRGAPQSSAWHGRGAPQAAQMHPAVSIPPGMQMTPQVGIVAQEQPQQGLARDAVSKDPSGQASQIPQETVQQPSGQKGKKKGRKGAAPTEVAVPSPAEVLPQPPQIQKEVAQLPSKKKVLKEVVPPGDSSAVKAASVPGAPMGPHGDAPAQITEKITTLDLKGQKPPPQKVTQSEQLQPKLTLLRTRGTKGRKIQVQTNHFELFLGKVQTAVHYDVELDPDRPKNLLMTVMEAFRKRFYPNRYPAFDGAKNLYSSSMLPFGREISGEVQVLENDREKTYKVKVKFAANVDLSALRKFFASTMQNSILMPPMDAIQCVDIVLRAAPIMSCIKVGRSFFPQPRGDIIDLGDGMEMYNGFFQSAVMGWKPFLNVDVAHKAFPKRMTVLNLINELFGPPDRPLYDRDVGTLEKFIRNLKVEYEIPRNAASKRVYRVNGLDKSPSAAVFTPQDGKKMTVQNYFLNEKNFKLNYAHLPTLWVGSKTRQPRILLPCELCTILPGQVTNRKMTENQTRNMIRYSATDTTRRKNKIMSCVNEAGFNDSPAVKEFGFEVSKNFTNVEARILDPPKLKYASAPVAPAKGVWRAAPFLQGAQLSKWTILNLDRSTRPDALANLKRMFMDNAKQLNLPCEAPVEPFENLSNYRNPEDIKNFFAKRKTMQMIVVIISNSGPHYSHVKKAAELSVGTLTQCIKSRTIFKLNVSTIQNILLKVNAKLNGLNHTLMTRPKCLDRPCMVMGADVTHPAPDSNEPSIAAVIASHDPQVFKYNLCWRLQPSRQEMIEDLEAITKEQLIYFYQHTRQTKPVHIFYIRDGVSDGQFEQVLRIEMQAIRRACTSLGSDFKPAITFIVVQKRHHTRFFPTRPQDSEDRNMNVPAGTCVDTTITHPRAQDFYLVSHASIQGVAKPTKYRVLWDDVNMPEDALEELMYHLCHMFTRCNRSVSYPAPTYYAHLAAARAKVYCEAERLDMDNLPREQSRLKIQDSIVKELPMFFV